MLAKEALRIPRLWEFYGLPGHPGTSCRSPLRPDENPSFSVYDDGRRWKDFGTDEGGDAADFVGRVEGLDKGAAARRLIALHRGELARGHGGNAMVRCADTDNTSSADAREERTRKRASWPVIRDLRDDERRQLADLRCLDFAAIELACERGILHATEIRGGDVAWVLSDRLRVNAQARRLDGQHWRHLPGEPKAWTMPGSEAAWPVGLANVGSFEDIILTEGGPDLLAAHQLILEGNAVGRIAPVAMLGASLRMTEATIERFRNRRVTLCPHLDANGHGLEAARRWAIQLRAVALSMSWIDLAGLRRADGQPVKDLCDLMSRGPGGHEVNAGEIARFAKSLLDGGAA